MAYRLLTTGTPNPEPVLYKTGSATLPAGSTSVVVTHDLQSVPTRVEVAPDCNISSVGETTFTITILYPQPSDVLFRWTVSPSTEYNNTGDIDGGTA